MYSGTVFLAHCVQYVSSGCSVSLRTFSTYYVNNFSIFWAFFTFPVYSTTYITNSLVRHSEAIQTYRQWHDGIGMLLPLSLHMSDLLQELCCRPSRLCAVNVSAGRSPVTAAPSLARACFWAWLQLDDLGRTPTSGWPAASRLWSTRSLSPTDQPGLAMLSRLLEIYSSERKSNSVHV